MVFNSIFTPFICFCGLSFLCVVYYYPAAGYMLPQDMKHMEALIIGRGKRLSSEGNGDNKRLLDELSDDPDDAYNDTRI